MDGYATYQELAVLYVVFEVQNVILSSSQNNEGSTRMADITIRIPDRALKAAVALLGAVLLSWGYSHLLASGVLRPKYQIQMFVPASAALQEGARVTLDGMPVGKVSVVRPAGNSTDPNRGMEVVLRIEKRYEDFIRQDSAASLVPEGFLGGRFVNIHRGRSGSPIAPGGEIRVVPAKEMSFADFLEVVGKAANCHNEEKDSAQQSPTFPKKAPQPQQPNLRNQLPTPD
jgi:ABC-type transporter Mla subunit MlaD